MWWTGAGVLAFVFPCGLAFLLGGLGSLIDPAAAGLLAPVGGMLGALATWLLGVRLNNDRDPGDQHTLYSVPMQYWSWLLGPLSVAALLHNLGVLTLPG